MEVSELKDKEWDWLSQAYNYQACETGRSKKHKLISDLKTDFSYQVVAVIKNYGETRD